MVLKAPSLTKKCFEHHVKRPRRLREADAPRYPTWNRLQRFIVEKLGDCDDENLESEIQKIFWIGEVTKRIEDDKDVKEFGPFEERFSLGWLDAKGFKAVAEYFDPFLLQSELVALFSEVDRDRDGKVSLKEFKEVVIYHFRAAPKKEVVRTLNLAQQRHLPDPLSTDIAEKFPETEGEVRTWYSLGLRKLCGRKDLTTPGLQQEIENLNGKRDELLQVPRNASWTKHNLFFDKSLQLQAYGATAALKLKSTSKARSFQSDDPNIISMPWQKAVALSLFDKRAPLVRCITSPHTALQSARGESEAEVRRRMAALLEKEREAETRFKLRLPDRDRNGRSLLAPMIGAKTARETYNSKDPRHVNAELLRKGVCRENVDAFLLAKQSERERQAAAKLQAELRAQKGSSVPREQKDDMLAQSEEQDGDFTIPYNSIPGLIQVNRQGSVRQRVEALKRLCEFCNVSEENCDECYNEGFLDDLLNDLQVHDLNEDLKLYDSACLCNLIAAPSVQKDLLTKDKMLHLTAFLCRLAENEKPSDLSAAGFIVSVLWSMCLEYEYARHVMAEEANLKALVLLLRAKNFSVLRPACGCMGTICSEQPEIKDRLGNLGAVHLLTFAVEASAAIPDIHCLAMAALCNLMAYHEANKSRARQAGVLLILTRILRTAVDELVLSAAAAAIYNVATADDTAALEEAGVLETLRALAPSQGIDARVGLAEFDVAERQEAYGAASWSRWTELKEQFDQAALRARILEPLAAWPLVCVGEVAFRDKVAAVHLHLLEGFAVVADELLFPNATLTPSQRMPLGAIHAAIAMDGGPNLGASAEHRRTAEYRGGATVSNGGSGEKEHEPLDTGLQRRAMGGDGGATAAFRARVAATHPSRYAVLVAVPRQVSDLRLREVLVGYLESHMAAGVAVLPAGGQAYMFPPKAELTADYCQRYGLASDLRHFDSCLLVVLFRDEREMAAT